MAEKRKATKKDEFLKIRLLAEGVRYEVEGQPQWFTVNKFTDVVVVFDNCDMVAETRENPRSRLTVSIDGHDVTISEMGEVLDTGTLQPTAPWRNALMSDGTKVDYAVFGTNGTRFIDTFNRCFAYDSGKGCKFCGAGHGYYAEGGPSLSLSGILQRAERPIEATVVAIEHGLRNVLLIGGAAPPEQRDQFTTDLFEGIMNRFRACLDDDLLSQVAFTPSVYPPSDFGQFHKWKALGINAVEMDCQVMDPAYFKAICPGRGDQKHWFEAQEAAVEVFGRNGGCAASVILGIEPMDGMLAGVEERVSKGVKITPLMYKPFPPSPMTAMQPATAEWYQEAFGKISEIFVRYGLPAMDGAERQSRLAEQTIYV